MKLIRFQIFFLAFIEIIKNFHFYYLRPIRILHFVSNKLKGLRVETAVFGQTYVFPVLDTYTLTLYSAVRVVGNFNI